jgi:hypothetical protein
MNQIHFFSDKCTPKEISKLENDFNEDLINSRFTSRAKLGKYLKNTEKVQQPSKVAEEVQAEEVLVEDI